MIVYKYGARPAGEDIRAQMRLGHMYYNQLVEAENARRRGVWGADTCPGPPHDDCTCGACKAHWKDIRDRMRACPPLDMKPLRAARPEGLFWGTYLMIEESFAAAWKKTGACSLVGFRSWRNGAQAAAQVQLGRDDGTYRIAKAPDPRTGRRARDGRGRHTLQIRIGSDGREPIWCEPIRFEMHRVLSGRVRWIKVRMTRVADREVWTVTFTCGESQHDELNGRDAPGYRTVAIDVSWRKIDGSLRIAFAQDGDGNTEELLLGPRWMELAARAERIRAERDRLKNAIIASDPRLAACRSCRGVARAIDRMRANGEEVGEDLIAWWHRDRHLWQYEEGCRRRSVAHRRDRMRVWLRSLRNRYNVCVVKDSSHKELKEKGDLPKPARRQGQHAAPGEVIEWIRRLWGREHVSVVAAKRTTITCACGHVSAPNGALMMKCERCGDEIDRDVQSTRNMLQAFASGEGGSLTARKTKARFAKRHEKPAEP